MDSTGYNYGVDIVDLTFGMTSTGTDAEPHQAAGTGAIKERTGKLFGLSALCTIGWIKGDSFLFEFCYNLIYPYIYNYITYGCKEINY